MFFGDEEAALRRRAVSAAVEHRLFDDLTLTAGAGASIGGDVTIAGTRHDLGPGPLGLVGAAYRILDGDGWEPFLLFSGAFSVSTVVSERAPRDDLASRLTALDLRAGLTAGEVFGDAVAPYATLRAFGGPILWQAVEPSGSDKYHFQLGLGLLVTAGILDAFIEVVPLGERAATFAFSESGPQVITHQAPMSRERQSRPARSAPPGTVPSVFASSPTRRISMVLSPGGSRSFNRSKLATSVSVSGRRNALRPNVRMVSLRHPAMAGSQDMKWVRFDPDMTWDAICLAATKYEFQAMSVRLPS